MKNFKDQLNRNIKVSYLPQRIVSLVPSQTELLVDLGLEDKIIGITRFCIHPKHLFKSKIKVGGTKNYHLDKIRALQPDLIIANKEENEKLSLEKLAKEFPVWISDITKLEEAYQMILEIGKMTQTRQKASDIVSQIKKQLSSIKKIENKEKVAYLIWKEPLMSINKQTFINEILEESGFQNVFANKEDRYPEVSFQEIKDQNIDYLFLSSEPYPFTQKHLPWFEKKLPKVKIKLVDGEMFSWYGSRLLKLKNYIHTLR